MFEWDMSEAALNSYEQDAEDIYTTARILRLIKQVRDHRKEIEHQRALIDKAKVFARCVNACGKCHDCGVRALKFLTFSRGEG